MVRSTPVNEAITVDEVGIESGRYRSFTLRSAYQPIFEIRGERLVPVAVEGLIRPFVEGQARSAFDLFGNLPERDRFFVESLCRALHLRNFHSIGVDGLELFFNYGSHAHGDPATAIGQIDHMVARLREIGLDTAVLVCEITELEAFDRAAMILLAAQMRGNGIRLAIDDFGAGYSTMERVELIDPDFVKVDGHWFRRIAGNPEAARLLGLLVKGLKERGAQVLIEGIETPEELAAAIEMGADMMQGYLLSRPALVGTIFNPEPLAIDALLGNDANVVRLFG